MKKTTIVAIFALTGVIFGYSEWVNLPDQVETRQLTRAEVNNHKLQRCFDNMKNQFTPGYKSDLVLSDEVQGSGLPSFKDIQASISFKQGKVFRTQIKTNLAIAGRGLFVIGRPGKLQYTRDGRFEFKDGALSNPEGISVLGYPLDTHSNISGSLSELELTMDMTNKLYNGKYTDFYFDSAGRFYGLHTLKDSTTGHKIETTTPLFQIALAAFEAPSALKRKGTSAFVATEESGQAVLGVPEQGALGYVSPGHLELSNVDYMETGFVISRIKQNEERRRTGAVTLYGELSQLSQSLLAEEGVVATRKGHLTILEGRSSGHLLQALSVAFAEGEENDAESIRKLMLAVEPDLVFVE